MNRIERLFVLLALAAFATPSQAADVAAGKATGEEVCFDCHGEDGKGDDESPDITSSKLSTREFVQAMNEYRDGTRTKHAKMARAAKKLSDDDVANVAAYFATLK